MWEKLIVTEYLAYIRYFHFSTSFSHPESPGEVAVVFSLCPILFCGSLHEDEGRVSNLPKISQLLVSEDRFRPRSLLVSKMGLYATTCLCKNQNSGLWMGLDGWVEFGQAVDWEGSYHWEGCLFAC